MKTRKTQKNRHPALAFCRLGIGWGIFSARVSRQRALNPSTHRHPETLTNLPSASSPPTFQGNCHSSTPCRQPPFFFPFGLPDITAFPQLWELLCSLFIDGGAVGYTFGPGVLLSSAHWVSHFSLFITPLPSSPAAFCVLSPSSSASPPFFPSPCLVLSFVSS
jgi:hypothetical protein